MTSFRLAGALTAAAALAVPAAAAAHPSVYTSPAKVEQPAGSGTFVDQTRYVVANHGFTFVLRESNSSTTGGVFDYKSMPSKLRQGKDWAWLLANGATGAQAHATCQVPALSSENAIRDWQGADPFYAYVPFQKESAGLDDDPASWIAYVKRLTGDRVDLSQLDSAAAAEAACETLPDATASSYVPADATQSSNAAFNAGLIEHVSAPLDAEIGRLTTALTSAEGARAALQTALDAAKAELAKLATPMKAALPSARLKAAALAKRGTAVTVSGLAGAPVKVELAIPERQARKLKLTTSVLARAKATLGADGTATVGLKAKRPARKALRKLKRSVAFEVTVTSGDRFVTSSGTLASGAAAPARASAHTEVKSTSPAQGSTASTSIRAVTVTFTQAIRSGSLRVTGPGGTTVSNGSGGRDPRKVTRLRVGLRGALKAGRYKARWTIKAADGHNQSGSFRFRLR